MFNNVELAISFKGGKLLFDLGESVVRCVDSSPEEISNLPRTESKSNCLSSLSVECRVAVSVLIASVLTAGLLVEELIELVDERISIGTLEEEEDVVVVLMLGVASKLMVETVVLIQPRVEFD